MYTTITHNYSLFNFGKPFKRIIYNGGHIDNLMQTLKKL